MSVNGTERCGWSSSYPAWAIRYQPWPSRCSPSRSSTYTVSSRGETSTRCTVYETASIFRSALSQKSACTVILAVRAVITGVCVPVGVSHAPFGMNAWFGTRIVSRFNALYRSSGDVRACPSEPQDLPDAEVELC